MPDVRLERTLRVPADPATEALSDLLKAIAGQEGPWRGFALHIALGDLRLPDVGYVAVPIRLSVERDPEERRAFGISFNAASLLSGNGIDVNALVSEVQAAQSGQLTAWQGDLTNLQTQATTETSINNDLSNLASAVAGLTEIGRASCRERV